MQLPDDFDAKAYLSLNPDLKATNVDPVEHYLQFGALEGRPYKAFVADPMLEKALARYTHAHPSEKNAFDLFSSSWSTSVADVHGQPLTAGGFAGLTDPRIEWLTNMVSVSGLKILELGPLEGAHTVMLEQAGGDVIAIEANLGAFLRCLIIKNYFGLSAKFLLGDFQRELFSGQTFDLVVASGVLYHMVDPVGLLKRLSSCSDRLFLWTHYFDFNFDEWHPEARKLLERGKWDFENPEEIECEGLKIRVVKQKYGKDLGWTGFCGGTELTSKWVVKDDLIKLLNKLGYERVEIAFDVMGQIHGPSFCLYAEK